MTRNNIMILKALNIMPGNTIGIADVLLKIFPLEDKQDIHLVTKKKKAMLTLLERMQKAELIKYISPTIGNGNIIDGYAWLDTNEVLASITKKGQDALAEYHHRRRMTINRILNYTSLFIIAHVLFKLGRWLKIRSNKK